MIAYDLQAIQSADHGERGIARFVGDLARTLFAEHPDVVDVFLWNDSLPFVPRLEQLELGDRLRSFSDMRGATVDILHVNSPFEGIPIGDFAPPLVARRIVATCYDLIPYRFPDRYLRNPIARTRYNTRLALLATADAIVTDSQSAASDAMELLGVPASRLTVIGAGVGPQFRPPDASLADRMSELDDALPGIEPNFVLVPSGMDWRKNTVGAVNAFAMLPTELRQRHQLVLSCRLDEQRQAELVELCEALGVSGRVLVTGYVSDEVLITLYQSAQLVLFPSFYEGFGLPVLEARRCGARVICANSSSMPEVLVDPRSRFEPYDTSDMAAKLEQALADPSFAAILDRVPDSGFTWSQAARRLVGVYKTLGGTPSVGRQQRSDGRRRLGVVTPFPPAQSGVAEHSSRLMRAIHDHIDDVEVVAFVESGASGLGVNAPYPIRELSSLPYRWAAGELDAVLYCFGNHPIHRAFYPMLRRVPGHVFLHDIRLLGAFDEHLLGPLVARFYDEPPRDPLLTAPVANSACSVLVQSRYAATLVERECGVQAVDVGPVHCRAVDQREASDEPSGLPWVISAGVADTTKRTATFVAAAKILVVGGVARASVVGEHGDDFVAEGDTVSATGRVTDDELDSWLRRASVVVQLRDGTNGESSGIVSDAIALGCAVVVSDVGAMGELPDTVVVKVPEEITPQALADVISGLLEDDARCRQLRASARAYAAQETPLAQARRVVEAIFH